MKYDLLIKIVSAYETLSSSKDLTPRQIREQIKRETRCTDAELDHVLSEVFKRSADRTPTPLRRSAPRKSRH